MSLNLFQDFDNSAKDIFINTAQIDTSMEVGLPTNPNIVTPIILDGNLSIITADQLNANGVLLQTISNNPGTVFLKTNAVDGGRFTITFPGATGTVALTNQSGGNANVTFNNITATGVISEKASGSNNAQILGGTSLNSVGIGNVQNANQFHIYGSFDGTNATPATTVVQSGAITNLVKNGTGSYTLSYASGIFFGLPFVIAQITQPTVPASATIAITNVTNSTFQINTWTNAAVPFDYGVSFMVVGKAL